MTDLPVYSYEDLRKKADEFLREHYPSGNIPVPIEEIVEFDFKINIVPILGLQREFESHELFLIESVSGGKTAWRMS